MIFATYFITAICFPSIIVYKPLPGVYFENPSDDYTFTRIDMMGVINVGTFFVSSGIGTMIADRYTKRDRIKMRARFCILIVAVESLFCAYILWVTIRYLSTHPCLKSPLHFSLSYVAMVGLAFFHGFTSTLFMTHKPSLSDIPHSQQA